MKNKLIIQLNKQSKVKKDDIEGQMQNDFDSNNFLDLMIELKNKISESNEYSGVFYNIVTDPKVIELLETEYIRNNITEYTNKYNELIDKSTYYKRGIFNPSKADNVSKSLKKEKYFDAEHSLILNGDKEPIKDIKTLSKRLDDERNQIFENKELKNISTKIASGVVAVKNFQDLLEIKPEIAIELSDINKFKQKLWLYYLKTEISIFENLVSIYSAGKKRMQEIEKAAKIEETLWFDAKTVFKERFYIPFEIDIKDQENVILGTKSPNIIFEFKDKAIEKAYTKNELL